MKKSIGAPLWDEVLARSQNGRKPSNLVLTGVLLALSLALLVSQAGAQLGNSSISGTITDPTGAPVPDAKVVVTNVRTGTSITVATNTDGRYSAPQLGVGEYEVQAQKEGFQTIVHSGITVTVGSNEIVDFVLSVGKVTQQIKVTGEPPLVNTTDSTVGSLVTAGQIQDLPLNGRNYEELVLLSPGVQAVSSLGGVGWGMGSPLRYSTSGLRGEGQAILLDGTNIQGFWAQGPGVTILGTSLGVESIAEFKVVTDTYPAQYGGFGAAIIEVTRSGTNLFHGSGYFFTRNSAMDARNFYDPPSGPPSFYRYQYGGSIGGPIQKNKTFFFANYEGLREKLGISSIYAVPDQNARNGFLPCSAAPDVECNQSTGLANVGVSPGTAAIVNMYPTPNGPDLGGGVAENLQPLFSPSSENYAIVRVDHNFSSSDSMFARYLFDFGAATVPNAIPTQTIPNMAHNQYFTVAERKIISPTLINSATLGFTRTYNDLPGGRTPALELFPGRPAMWLFVGGLTTIAADPFKQGENRFTLSDDVIWAHGRHSLKYGVAFTRTQANADFPLFLGGVGVVLSLEDLMQNNIFEFQAPTIGADDAVRAIRNWRFGPYIQDDWQVRPRLTLNLGFRYEFMTNPVEAQNKLYALINPLTDSAYTHVPNVFQTNPANKNFAPRFGFAWDVFGTHKTSVRGGFGMFYYLYNEEVLLDSYSFDAPLYNMSNIFFTSFPNPFASTLVLKPSPTETTYYGTNKTPYAMEYNLNIQQQMSRDTLLTIGYVGSLGRHAMNQRYINVCPPTQILAGGTEFRDPTQPCINPNPAFGLIGMHFSDGMSNYNALQASVVRRLPRGLQFTSSYTYSKTMDDLSGFTGVDQPLGEQEFTLKNLANVDHNVDYAPSGFDNRHNWTNSLIYDLPFNRNRLVNGWQLGLIGSLQSGHPFDITDGFDECNTGGAANGSCRPNYASPAVNPKVGKVNEWFNPAAYALQPVGVNGNVGRNTVVGPGLGDLDVSLSKTMHVTEHSTLSLRVDAFNITNHPNFAVPISTVFLGNGAADPLAGIIFGAGTSRQIQLSARFAF